MGVTSQLPLPHWYAAAGCIAVALTLYAFWIYNQDNNKVNTGTWIILAIGDSLDLASYFGMTEIWMKNLVPMAFAIGSIITFGYALSKKRFSWPDCFDWFVVGMDVAITVIWLLFASATAANLLYQATTVTAFVPMYRGLINGKEKENPLPWALWSLAFLTLFVSTILTGQRWEEAVYPGVCFLTHSAVILLTKKARR